jgi:excisionase family DNA binding protein
MSSVPRRDAVTAGNRSTRDEGLHVYLTIQEAAVRLRCSTKTVRRYVARGQLVGYRVGPTMLRIRTDELDAMVASGAIPSARSVR